MTKTRPTWTADFLSDTTNNNHCSASCMVLCVSGTSVFEILFKILFCVCVLCGILLQASANTKYLYLSRFVHEHVLQDYVHNHACSFSSLPQVGDYRMTAVKRAEAS